MTKNTFFKIVIVLSLLINCALSNAQVTVGGNTQPNATLDVVATKTDGSTAEGLIAPRLTGDQLQSADLLYGPPQNAAIVYVTAGVTTTPSSKTINVKRAGYYYYDAPNSVWIAVNGGKEEWFYMPSFKLPLGTTPGEVRHFNLYDEYLKQFAGFGSNTVSGGYKTSPGASVLPYISDVSNLEFYVTAYNSDVITIGDIDATGDLTYTVNSTNYPDGSFINVIFKVK